MTTEAYDAAVAQLKVDEGYRADPYKDSIKGVLTIGYGCALRAWSPAFAEQVLRVKLDECLQELITALPWVSGLDDVRGAVLLEMDYNLGRQGVLGFHMMLPALEHGDYHGAAVALRDSLADHEEPLRVERWAIAIESGVSG